MSGMLENKVALISGAARGQGEAEARLFVAEGARVMLTDVLDAQGRAVAESLGGVTRYKHLDVTSEADWKAVVDAIRDAFGKLDILVNNAGISHFASLEDTTIEEPYRQLPIPRIGQPEEVANMVCFITSDRCTYTTGSDFVIDGGMTEGVLLGAPSR